MQRFAQLRTHLRGNSEYGHDHRYRKEIRTRPNLQVPRRTRTPITTQINPTKTRALHTDVTTSSSSKTSKMQKILRFFSSSDSKGNNNYSRIDDTVVNEKGWGWLKLLGVGTVIVSGLQLALWKWEEKHKNATPVDVGWTYGIGILGALYAIKGKGHPNARLAMGLMSIIWSLRLGTYLLQTRLLKHSEEDGRYKTLRKKWGDDASRNFFLFFQAQALGDVLFSIPLLLCAMRSKKPGNLQTIAALLVGLGSVAGEALSDHQLNKFKGDPKNKGEVCREGLWNYSRHPNYFFEFSYWWSYVLLSMGSKNWLFSLVSPLTMLFLIFKVTGIPATEAQALETKGDKYKNYQETTSMFVPWFHKKSADNNVNK